MNILWTICTICVGLAVPSTAALAPTKPTITSVIEEDHKVTIHWQEPEQWHGEKEMYNITISCLEPSYFYSIGCNVPTNEFVIIADSTDTSYTANKLESGMDYKVAVSARSSGVWSQPAIRSFTTMDDNPDPVEQLECTMVAEGNNKVKLVAKWKTPCQQKSKALKYEIKVCQQSDAAASCKMYNTVPSRREESKWSTTDVEANKKYRLEIYASNLRNNSPAVTCLVPS